MAKRTCTKCGSERARSEFYVQRQSPSGLHPWCKSCFRADRAKHYWDDPDKSRAAAVRSRTRNLDAARRRDRDRSKTPEYRERQRSYGRHTQPNVREYQRSYREDNREAFVKYSTDRRARKLDLPSDDYTRREIEVRDNWRCQLCGDLIWFVVRGTHSKAPSIDHIVPVTDPNCPGDIRSNVQLAHFGCNSSKGGHKQ